MKHETETKILSDNRLTSFLSHEGFTVTAFRNEGKTVFSVKGVGLSESIKKYYNNPEIRLFDYFRHFDLVRDMIRGQK